MKSIWKTAGYTVFLSLLVSAQAWAAESAGVDFSCMKEQVRPIIQVTDQHREFDVVVRNHCPGSVYWSMCIERMDPWTHKILESHSPAGHVEVDKRSRVNLQMKATPNAYGDLNRAQEFYLNVAYSIKGPARANCVARTCEAKKTVLRAESAKNAAAWRKAWTAVEAKMTADCPDHGWNTSDTEACRKAISDAAAEDLAEYEEKDNALREQLSAIDPETCAVYGGQVLELKKNP